MRKYLSSAWQALFGDPVRAFGVVSVALLLALAIAPAKEHFSQWHGYQRQYLRLIRDRGDAVSLRRRFQPGVHQIWLPELSVVDRCTTCHLGLNETGLADVNQQPFRKHPAIPHSLDGFGCVICHGGQGAATTVAEAHHSERAGEEPILPARYIESGCGQCHQNALPGTPQLNLGRKILTRYGCVHCHAITLPDGTKVVATDHPPSLAHIADKTTRKWIYTWLKDPQAYAASTTMPNYKLSDADASDISAYLVSTSTQQAGDTATAGAKPAAQTDPAAGPSLYGESFCSSCHAVQNAAGNLVGGAVGPELTRIGNKVKPEWLAAWLQNPRIYDATTPMPHYRFTPQQITILAGFLQGKSDSDYGANVHLDAANANQIAHGRKRIVELGCAACHEINGVQKPENFAPELSTIGSKPLAQIVFLPGMEHTLSSYIVAKIRQPRAFGSSVKMPQFTLSNSQTDALATALLALTSRSRTMPDNLRVAAIQESNYQPAGHAGKLITELACFSCHRINGRGGDMAPDLTWEGSAVQRQWLTDFLHNPNTLRPSLIRRMPRFNLSESDNKVLTDYILTVYQSPAIDPELALTNSPQMVEHGRQLFYSKFACQSCHIVDTKTDKGYIGPTLTQVGSRLTPAWIYAWLRNPQELRPGTTEPNQNLSDDDARALTAFLMTLKNQGGRGVKQ
ncbi:MAG: c-type cytochrome [Terracidiphilus sp.]|jgi:mono/diheme cytochrome c family protein